MLPFSPLHHLYSPQLTRMAFETVIKCLCSTRPLHYSQIPIDPIIHTAYTVGITVISPKQIAAVLLCKPHQDKIKWPKKSFC